MVHAPIRGFACILYNSASKPWIGSIQKAPNILVDHLLWCPTNHIRPMLFRKLSEPSKFTLAPKIDIRMRIRNCYLSTLNQYSIQFNRNVISI